MENLLGSCRKNSVFFSLKKKLHKMCTAAIRWNISSKIEFKVPSPRHGVSPKPNIVYGLKKIQWLSHPLQISQSNGSDLRKTARKAISSKGKFYPGTEPPFSLAAFFFQNSTLCNKLYGMLSFSFMGPFNGLSSTDPSSIVQHVFTVFDCIRK